MQKALHHLQFLANEGVPLDLLQDFLESSLFAQVISNPCFLLALEDWLVTKPPLDTSARNMLLSRLNFFLGSDPALYPEIYLLLTEDRLSPTYYGSVEDLQKKRNKQMRIVFLGCALVFILSFFLQYFSPESKSARQNQKLAEWISQDLGITAHKTQQDGSFTLDEIPGLVFQATPRGTRDPENGQVGYVSNFSRVAFERKLQDFANTLEHCTVTESSENDLSPSSNHLNAYGLSFPLNEGKEAALAFGGFLDEIQQEPWYQASPPNIEIGFTRSGVQYYSVILQQQSYKTDFVADYCETEVPLKICAFLINESKLALEDFPDLECQLMEIGIGDPDGDPFWQFAAVDTRTKDVVRVYAYSDNDNVLISYPPEVFDPDITLTALRKKCEPWMNTDLLKSGFPHFHRYSDTVSRFNDFLASVSTSQDPTSDENED